MDQTIIFEAAKTGDVNYLHQLVRDNPLIFNTIALTSTTNPLHIAAGTGHADLAKEILILKSEFARELNEDGFSALHMASANGHVDVVRELLNFDKSLCLLQGRERKSPLHFAAMKGRVEVINAMLFACCECIEGVNVQGETALHLAVKNNQFEAVKVMVDWIRENNKFEILNAKDERGNTVLHLATWKKQRQVIELLLCEETPTSSFLEVNAINHNSLTALDMLVIFPSEAGDYEIVEILRAVGAKRARDIAQSNISNNSTSINASASSNTRRSQSKEFVEYFKFKRGRDSPSEARSALLVVASLVATTTFRFAISPPGNVWPDTYIPSRDNFNNNSVYQGAHYAGEAIWGTTNMVAFVLFMFFNSIGLYVSLYMINILTSRFPLQLELQICIIALYSTYNTALVNITPNHVQLYVILTTSIFSSTTPWILKLIRQHSLKLWKLVLHAFRRNP